MGMEKIAIIGSGNWGSAIAKIIGENAAASAQLDTVVQMYTYEEEVDGGKLTEIINSKHENVKYLPGVKLPDNVVANPDVVSSVKDATLLVFVLPHQFIGRLASALKGNLAPGARAISLIKVSGGECRARRRRARRTSRRGARMTKFVQAQRSEKRAARLRFPDD